MNVQYFLINKKHMNEYEAFVKAYEKLQRSIYLKLLRYCKDKNGVVVNKKFGENFGEAEAKRYNELKKQLMQKTYYPIGFANKNGFFMRDMSPLGIYNILGLIGFLKSNRDYKIVDSRGVYISPNEFKKLLAAKGVHLHWASSVKQENIDLLNKAINNLKSIIKKQDEQTSNIDPAYIESESFQTTLSLKEELQRIISRLEDIYDRETGEFAES